MCHIMDQNPVLPSFLPIQGQLEYSKRSQISTAPVLIIHFKLVDHPTAGSPADMIHSFLQPYFPHGGLHLLDVIFDFGTARKTNAYSQQCTALVNDLEKEEYSLVCIIITTHTDDTHGDPFVGHDKKDVMGLLSVHECFAPTVARRNPMRSRIDAIFMGCGAIINQSDAFRDLRSSVLEYTFSSAVAFTAPHFQPPYTCHLALAYAELVLIERFNIREAFPEILAQSYRLGMHTSIILMTRFKHNGAAALECTRYAWAHTASRPWGFTLPVQCPQCGCVGQWNSTYSSGMYIVECSYTGCGRSRDNETTSRQKYTFKRPRGSKRLKPGKRHNAEWLEIPLDFSRPNAG
ncbi:hypothetical protein BD769DRAFT_1667596 [Suillus cothurnatus]|nr:hypothetical protein BD769DRAFT_1667596 [Suillus cothurnatus]